jgi:hypothetical protein
MPQGKTRQFSGGFFIVMSNYLKPYPLASGKIAGAVVDAPAVAVKLTRQHDLFAVRAKNAELFAPLLLLVFFARFTKFISAWVVVGTIGTAAGHRVGG